MEASGFGAELQQIILEIMLGATTRANPAKQDRYLPGSHVPIRAPDAVKTTRPDYVVILPWNLKDEITRQLAFISDWGGRFVVASPTTQVLD